MADPLSPEDLPNSPYGGNGPLLMGVTWTLAIIAMILMGLRTYANAVVVKKFTWDYFWAMLTLVRRIMLPCALRRSKLLLMSEDSSPP